MFIGFELIFSPTVVPTNAVNGLGLCEEAELEVQIFKIQINYDSRTNIKERTNTAIAYSRC